MKKQYSKQSAFSLIELSIVLVVTGLLVVGISKASTLISTAKVRAIQMLGQNSVVAQMSSLSLWYDATAVGSFKESGGAISTWYDINKKSDATQETLAQQPTYISNGINGLPSVNFGEAGGDSVYSNNNLIFSMSDLGGDDSYSIFIVNDGAASTSGGALVKYVNNSYGVNFGHVNNSTLAVSHLGEVSSEGTNNNTKGALTMLATPSIHTATYNNATLKSILYIDGENILEKTMEGGPSLSASENHTLGTNSASYKRQIGEVIVFNKGLSGSEVRKVHEYLSKKWNIVLAE